MIWCTCGAPGLGANGFHYPGPPGCARPGIVPPRPESSPRQTPVGRTTLVVRLGCFGRAYSYLTSEGELDPEHEDAMGPSAERLLSLTV